ncbi:hypothetical protein [Halobacteriovorax sp. HLS]|uniref:hypothetical protein n=1 Tax=Halobacteriovorax sp. HLS TaxID=2234000 RepID=UPI000FD884E0|nr:hypothetical protein [Halobacteriovorax sp. HLS]
MKTSKETKLKKSEKSLIRRISASVSILSLVYSTSAIAVEKGSVVDSIDKVFDTTMQMMQQSMQQSQMQAQQAAMMSALQPQTIPSKFFPHCKISQARGAFPKRACSTGVSSPAALSGIEQMSNLGAGYADMYEQLLSPAQNSAYPVGLQCLDNAKKGMVKSLQDRMNSLQGLKDKIEKEAQLFKEKNKKLLTDMKNDHVELFGNSGQNATNDMDAITRDFSKYFDTNCQNIIGQDNISKAATVGLNGIKIGLNTKNKTAVNYSLNQSTIEGDLNKQIQKVKSQIKSQGIQQWLADVGKGDGSINGQDLARMGVNKPAISIVTTEINRFDSKLKTIQSELKKIDPSYEIPPMDKNFGVDFAEFTKGADDFFKKKYINDCVTMADQGVAISTDQILSSLTSGTRGGGNIALKNYKAALQNILNSDAFIEDKMAQIQQLDERFKGSDITITYKNSGSETVRSSTYELYKNTVASCGQKYTQDDTFSTSGAKGVSQQKKIKRAKQYLNDLKTLESTFASQIGNKIYDAVVSCSGRSEKPATCSTTDVFNQDSDAFCMKHATSCSAKVQQCFQKADALVTKKKMDIKSKQATYNKNVAALVAREEAYLAQVKAQVLADSEYLAKYFPGANYNLPEGMFIKMPEKSASDFGVELAGGGSLDFMKDLPEQIGKLKLNLEEQSGKIEGVITDYINEQRAAMETQKQKWDQLSNECYAAAQKFRADVAAGNAKMQEEQAKYQQGIGDFCNKYGQLGNSNPLAGCDDSSDYSAQSLYEDMSGVVSGISAEHEMALSEYRNACAQFNNESEKGTEDDDDDEDKARPSAIASVCKKAKSKAGIQKALLKMGLEGLPENLTKHKTKISKYIKSGDEDHLEDIKGMDEDFKERIENISAAYRNDEYDNMKADDYKERVKEIIEGKYPEKEINKSFTGITTACSSDENKVKAFCKSFASSASTLKEKADAINDFISQGGSEAVYKPSKIEVSSKASTKMAAELDEIQDKFKDGDNFCAAHKNEALVAAVEKCLEKDSSTCWESEWKKKQKLESDVTRDIDRAIASIQDNSFDAKWQRIGERTKNVNCQASSESERGVEDYLKQMQQIGGADFSGQRGFGL